MQNQALQEIEQDIQQSLKTVELGDSLARLFLNRDFKLVVLKGFFELEAIRLVHLKSEVAQQSPDAQQSIVRRMDAIGTFNLYLQEILLQSEVARKNLAMSEQERAELTLEDLE